MKVGLKPAVSYSSMFFSSSDLDFAAIRAAHGQSGSVLGSGDTTPAPTTGGYWWSEGTGGTGSTGGTGGTTTGWGSFFGPGKIVSHDK